MNRHTLLQLPSGPYALAPAYSTCTLACFLICSPALGQSARPSGEPLESRSAVIGQEDAHTGGVRLVYVDDDAPLGGDGVTWPTAYRYLQDALLDASTTGGPVEIRVAEGVYKPDQDEAGNVVPGDKSVSFELFSSLSLLGGYAGIHAANPDQRDIDQFETILTGDLLGNDVGTNGRTDNSFTVVNGFSVGSSTRMEGFTIMRGAARFSGGGLVAGAGMKVSSCSFQFNSAADSGGGVAAFNRSRFVDCEFIVNKAAAGGGLAATGFASPGAVTIQNCRFIRNTATIRGGGFDGFSDGVIANSLFIENRAADLGGGLHSVGGRLANCTLINNDAGFRGGGAFARFASNCIFWDNTDSSTNGTESGHFTHFSPLGHLPPELYFSVIQGGWTGDGWVNTSQFPLFVDSAADDYRLYAQSPAIDWGDDLSIPADALDLNTNGDVNEPIPFDLDGNMRQVGSSIDAGAYEAQLDAPVYGDFDDDGDLDFDDFLLFSICTSVSGPNTAPVFNECVGPFDSDGDGDIDLRDYQILTTVFGP